MDICISIQKQYKTDKKAAIPSKTGKKSQEVIMLMLRVKFDFK